MAITIITKNSVVASKRPTGAQLVTGELGLNSEATDPGLYFEDSAGNIRKVGGAHYGATAPNAAAAGQAGNSVGELWYNTADLKLYIWDGAAWVVAGGTDSQAFYLAGPWATGVLRPDTTPLLPGDEWYDTSTVPATAYVWSGAAWVYFASGDTHSFTGAGDPVTLAVTLRPDGSVLQNGDVYVDTTLGQERAYRYDLATTSWTNIDNKAFTQDTTPPVAVSFDGDQWYDSTTLESFVYYDDGTSKQWVQMIAPDPSAGNGTVTSIDFIGIDGITVSGGPITNAGTITLGIDITALPALP